MVRDGDPLCPSGAVVLRGRRGSIERHGPASKWAKGLCTWCGETITAPRRETWCSTACTDAYLLTQPEHLAAIVEERDHGVCELCTRDTWRLRSFFHRYGYGWGAWEAWTVQRGEGEAMVVRSHTHGRKAKHERAVVSAERPFRLLGLEPRTDLFSRDRWWDLDHRLPLAEGGEPFDLANLRTLCVWCHAGETAALAGRLALRRATAA